MLGDEQKCRVIFVYKHSSDAPDLIEPPTFLYTLQKIF